MEYLTYRELFALKETLALTDEQLDEPVLFTVQDGYGNQEAYPVKHWTESLHPSDGTSTLSLDGESLEMSWPSSREEDLQEQEEQEQEERDEDDEEDAPRVLRKLPLGALRLGYSEMDEDFEEATEWLAQPNPHTPPPPAAAPRPAPLFE